MSRFLQRDKRLSRFYPEESRARHHRSLKLSPVFWPCLPEPKRQGSAAARALYAELDAALSSVA
jgi:hypothetical protein